MTTTRAQRGDGARRVSRDLGGVGGRGVSTAFALVTAWALASVLAACGDGVRPGDLLADARDAEPDAGAGDAGSEVSSGDVSDVWPGDVEASDVGDADGDGADGDDGGPDAGGDVDASGDVVGEDPDADADPSFDVVPADAVADAETSDVAGDSGDAGGFTDADAVDMDGGEVDGGDVTAGDADGGGVAPPCETCVTPACRLDCVRPPECADDEACGRGARCAAGRCVAIGHAPCDEDARCGVGWTCGEAGWCAECAGSGDCAVGEECVVGACRPPPLASLWMDVSWPEPFASHPFHKRKCELAMLGGGMGMADLDGDGRDDVILGTYVWPDQYSPLSWCVPPAAGPFDEPACVFLNRSTPGELAWEKVPELCDGGLPRFSTAFGVDVESDGRDEALLLADGKIWLLRMHPERRLDLVSDEGGLNVRDPYCFAGAAVSVDLDLDGVLEVVVGCQFALPQQLQTDEAQMENLVLRVEGDSYVVDTRPEWEPFRDGGSALAIAVADADRDGLPDVVVANDSFELPDWTSTFLPAGFMLRRCGPMEPCVWTRASFGTGQLAGGSYMGIGQLTLDGVSSLYVTDWGDNRLLQWNGSAFEDIAEARGARNGWVGQERIVGWSAIVDDFDFDGRDDVLVTNGQLADEFADDWRVQFDTLLRQRPDGAFDEHRSEIGLVTSSIERSPSEGYPTSGRAGVRTDLDLDGRMDVLVVSYPGSLRRYAENPPGLEDGRRCLLRPISRTVHTFGTGYRVRAPGERDSFGRDVQGHARFGAPRTILAASRSGTLVFPSGAEVGWTCASDGEVTWVEEPPWLQVRNDQGVLALDVDRRYHPGVNRSFEVFVRDLEGRVRIGVPAVGSGATRSVALASGDRAFLLRIDGRYVPRWFAIPPPILPP